MDWIISSYEMEQLDVSGVEVYDDNYNLVTDPEEAVDLLMERVITGELRSLPVNANYNDTNIIWSNLGCDFMRQD